MLAVRSEFRHNKRDRILLEKRGQYIFMKKTGNELLQFLAGLAMLVVGLYIFSQKVMVSSSFFGGGMWLGGFRMSGGIIMIPFIIGIIWMFASGGSFASKVFSGLGVLLIIVSIILSTNISLVHISLFEWIVILVLIFGGAGILARILLAVPRRNMDVIDENERLDDNRDKVRRIERSIDIEIEEIKKNNP